MRLHLFCFSTFWLYFIFWFSSFLVFFFALSNFCSCHLKKRGKFRSLKNCISTGKSVPAVGFLSVHCFFSVFCFLKLDTCQRCFRCSKANSHVPLLTSDCHFVQGNAFLSFLKLVITFLLLSGPTMNCSEVNNWMVVPVWTSFRFHLRKRYLFEVCSA